ncbi:DUF6599 family protein [Fibrobacterota bacterium]
MKTKTTSFKGQNLNGGRSAAGVPAADFGLIVFFVLLACVPVFPLSLPDKILADETFTAISKQEEYGRSTLYELINGGADVYLDAGFQRCFSRRYKSDSNEVEIEVNVHDMGGILQAFGLFRQLNSSSKSQDSIGAEAVAGKLRSMFWKDRFYVEVLDKSSKPFEESRLKEHMKAIAALVPGNDSLPPQLTWFPESRRKDRSEFYFHQNFLSRGFLRKVIAADYETASGTATLFVLMTSSQKNARLAFFKLGKAYPERKLLEGDYRLAELNPIFTDELLAVVRGNKIIGVKGNCAPSYKVSLIEKCSKRVMKFDLPFFFDEEGP